MEEQCIKIAVLSDWMVFFACSYLHLVSHGPDPSHSENHGSESQTFIKWSVLNYSFHKSVPPWEYGIGPPLEHIALASVGERKGEAADL